MRVYTQDRPSWCPHTDCLFRRRVMDNLCGGELPAPAPHDGDVNTHRVCINTGEGPVFDLQVNPADLDWMRWIFDALDGKKSSWLSNRSEPKFGLCPDCKGRGMVEPERRDPFAAWSHERCRRCKGVGSVPLNEEAAGTAPEPPAGGEAPGPDTTQVLTTPAAAPLPAKYMMAKAWAHKSLDMKLTELDDWDIIRASYQVDHPELGTCFVGNFITGVGMIEVHYPADSVRPCTPEEKAKYVAATFSFPGGINFKLMEKDFA